MHFNEESVDSDYDKFVLDTENTEETVQNNSNINISGADDLNSSFDELCVEENPSLELRLDEPELDELDDCDLDELINISDEELSDVTNIESQNNLKQLRKC